MRAVIYITGNCGSVNKEKKNDNRLLVNLKLPQCNWNQCLSLHKHQRQKKQKTADRPDSVSGRLKMTLNGTDAVYAELTDTLATTEFLEQLPLMVDMHEHLDRQKESTCLFH